MDRVRTAGPGLFGEGTHRSGPSGLMFRRPPMMEPRWEEAPVRKLYLTRSDFIRCSGRWYWEWADSIGQCGGAPGGPSQAKRPFNS